MIRGGCNFLFCLFRKDRHFFFKLIRILGYLPSKVSLYRTAFTHKSASIELKDGTRINNERLEYLGDAMLGAIVADFIYMGYSHSDEGFMTKLRARIVKRKNLDSTAIKMGIPTMITSHSHPINTSKHLYGNALEALIGAIYLDKGYDRAAWFFKHRMIAKYMDLDLLVEKDSDYKSQLIEWAQKNKHEVLFLSKEKAGNRGMPPEFNAVVKVENRDLGEGKGGSKKDAEQRAAKEALKGILN